uniref:TPPC8 first Ig-like domain-containing protein n=1 Tax=Globodera pallida TaxID=36090 RepID=A0A183CMM6_GLOPA
MTINREVGIVTNGGLIDLEWVKPLVNCTTVATFPGLALSKIAYGTSDQTELQTFLGPHEEQPLSDGHGHPVFPSMPCYILVWEELHQILVDGLLKDSPNRIYSHFGLFSNEHTKNVKPSLLSSEEPFIVRLGLQNPFPFPLTLRNLCLSLDQIKLRPGCSPPFFDKFQSSIISELILPPLITDQQPSAIELKNSRQFVDLHVLPGPELEHFAVNGIKFELCSPPIQTEQPKDEYDQSVEKASVSAFVPISIRGKRLFKTKEQRISKEYGMDKRLSAVVCSDFVPLLSFRPIGGDPNFIKAITHWHPLETFCDQIVQIVFEIENVGKIDVEHFG